VKETDRLRDVLNGYHGNEAAKFLYEAWRLGYVTDEALRHVILEAWKHSWPIFAVREQDWLAMFSATGFVSQGTPQPTEPLTIYRGAELSTNGYGMSWSLIREIAEDHAEMQMMSKSVFAPGVFEVTISPDAVLAMAVEDAGEDEVIVNPGRLHGSSTPRLVDGKEMPDPLHRFELFLVALGRGSSRPWPRGHRARPGAGTCAA
jgi:hypothetical protein